MVIISFNKLYQYFVLSRINSKLNVWQKKIDKAIDVISHIAKTNGVKMNADEIKVAFSPLIKEVETQTDRETSIIDVLASMAKYTRVSVKGPQN